MNDWVFLFLDWVMEGYMEKLEELIQKMYTLAFTAAHMWEYCWGFIVGSLNTMTSAYFYSTKRSGQAIALNIVRSLVMNSLIITFLPKIFGSAGRQRGNTVGKTEIWRWLGSA